MEVVHIGARDAFPLASTFGPDWQEIAVNAWEVHGERLTAQWIGKHPGTRPALWWALDHGEERPVVNAAPEEQEALWRKMHTMFDVCHADILHGHGAAPGELLPWLEPQRDYLARHGLLTAAETAALSV